MGCSPSDVIGGFLQVLLRSSGIVWFNTAPLWWWEVFFCFVLFFIQRMEPPHSLRINGCRKVMLFVFRLVFGHLCVFFRGTNIWRSSADVDFHWLEADSSIRFVVFSMNWEFGNIVCSVCNLYFTYFSSNVDKFLTSYKILLPQPSLKVIFYW